MQIDTDRAIVRFLNLYHACVKKAEDDLRDKHQKAEEERERQHALIQAWVYEVIGRAEEEKRNADNMAGNGLHYYIKLEQSDRDDWIRQAEEKRDNVLKELRDIHSAQVQEINDNLAAAKTAAEELSIDSAKCIAMLQLNTQIPDCGEESRLKQQTIQEEYKLAVANAEKTMAERQVKHREEYLNKIAVSYQKCQSLSNRIYAKRNEAWRLVELRYQADYRKAEEDNEQARKNRQTLLEKGPASLREALASLRHFTAETK